MAYKKGDGLGSKNNRWIGGQSTRLCLFCGKEFKTYPSQDKKYCSQLCGNTQKRGKPSPKRNQIRVNCSICKKEIYRSPSHIENNNYCSKKCLYKSRVGQGSEEKGYQWKGDKVGYFGLHAWVQKHLGKASTCENPHCVYPRMMRGKNKMMMFAKRFEWSNISHEYKRDIIDWQQLCTSCHVMYDRHKLNLGAQ